MSKERAEPPLTWAIDYDDVIADTAEIIVAALGEVTGKAYEASELYDDVDLRRFWRNFRRWKAGRVLNRLLCEGLIDDVEPDPAAVDTMGELASMGDQLYIVTGRQEYLAPATSAMIYRHFPYVSGIEFTNYFSSQLGVKGLKKRTKGEVCAEIGADVIVDDLPRHIKSALEHNPDMEGILFGGDPRQNLGEKVVQCFTWEQVLHERERILASR